jgi:hypothetical protein
MIKYIFNPVIFMTKLDIHYVGINFFWSDQIEKRFWWTELFTRSSVKNILCKYTIMSQVENSLFFFIYFDLGRKPPRQKQTNKIITPITSAYEKYSWLLLNLEFFFFCFWNLLKISQKIKKKTYIMYWILVFLSVDLDYFHKRKNQFETCDFEHVIDTKNRIISSEFRFWHGLNH